MIDLNSQLETQEPEHDSLSMQAGCSKNKDIVPLDVPRTRSLFLIIANMVFQEQRHFFLLLQT